MKNIIGSILFALVILLAWILPYMAIRIMTGSSPLGTSVFVGYGVLAALHLLTLLLVGEIALGPRNERLKYENN